MKKSRHLQGFALSMLIIAGMGLAACQATGPVEEEEPAPTIEEEAAPAEAGEPIPIGVLSNLTGPETTSGVDMVRGVELAVAELNATGGINGRPLKLIIEDAEYQPQLGVDAAHKLIDINKVPVILNVGGSGIMLPVGEYAGTQNVVLINTGASSPQLRDLPTLCSIVPLDDIVGKVLGQWAYDDGYRTAVTAVPNNPYGIGVQDNATIGFEDAGGEVLEQIAYIEGEADYRPDAQRIADVGADVVLSATYGDDANLFLKQTIEVGADSPWYVTYPTILNVGNPEDANGRLFGLEPGWDLPEAQNFMNNIYAAEYGDPPSTPWANYSYDGMMLVGLTMRQCGPTADCLLESMPEVAQTYDGVTGRIKFDEDCQRPNAPLVKMVYQNGELKLAED